MFCWWNKSNPFFSLSCLSTFFARCKLVYELVPVQIVHRFRELVSWFYACWYAGRDAVRHIKIWGVIFREKSHQKRCINDSLFPALAFTLNFHWFLTCSPWCMRQTREEGDMQPSALGRHAGCLSKLPSVTRDIKNNLRVLHFQVRSYKHS